MTVVSHELLHAGPKPIAERLRATRRCLAVQTDIGNPYRAYANTDARLLRIERRLASRGRPRALTPRRS